MSDALKKELRLIKAFLSEYKKLVEDHAASNALFHPRCLAIISQPDMKNSDDLEWIAYNKWFDELQIGTTAGADKNIFEVFLEIPIHMLISAEELGKSFISKKDQKKLMKALKLISEIKTGE